MKLNIACGDLATALSQVRGIIPTRSTLPILNNVHLSAQASRVVVTANSLDMQASVSDICEVEKLGVTTVPGHMLLSLAKSLPKEKLMTLELGDGRLNVTCGRSKYDLPTLNPADFPTMPEMEDGAAIFRMPSRSVLNALEATRSSVSTEPTRYYLNGVAACLEGGKLAFVSTDGHRLSRVLECQPAGVERLKPSIIPTDAVVQMISLCGVSEGEVLINLSENRISISVGNIMFKSKLIAGTYPDYMRVIPRRDAVSFTVNAEVLGNALERLASVSSEREPAVGIKTNGSTISIRLGGGAARGAEIVDAEISAEAVEFGVNAKYVLDIIKTWPKDADLEFQVTDPGSPLLITSKSDPDQTSVIMPRRV